jgi:predicted nucleotide-binding protein (sugar kinase/HSP70/actin superfamily)
MKRSELPNNGTGPTTRNRLKGNVLPGMLCNKDGRENNARAKDLAIDFPGVISDGLPKKGMMGTYPSMGLMGELVESIVEFTDDELLSPYPNSNESLNLGTLNAPESACFPMKLIAGNLIQSIERGANGVGMITERGPCRLGMYSLSLRLILTDMGADCSWVDWNNTNIHSGYIQRFRELYRDKYGKSLSWLAMGRGFMMGLIRLAAVERLEMTRNHYLAREKTAGDLDEMFQAGAKAVRAARHPWTVLSALIRARNKMVRVPLDLKRRTVRVIMSGEVYCVVDPYANGQLERRLAQLGAEPCRVLWQTDYILHGAKLGRLGCRGGKPAALRAARPFMPEDIGGDAAANVGHAVIGHKRGDDGMIHLKPFGCMVEFIAENVLRTVSKKLDFPIMSLTLDDVNGAERLDVRVEAFVENLFRRRYARMQPSG